MKTKITFFFAFIFGLYNQIYAQVTPGSVVTESVPSSLSTPCNGYTWLVPVLIIRYLPTVDGVNVDQSRGPSWGYDGTWQRTLVDLKNYISRCEHRTKYCSEESSRFRGYKNGSAIPSLGYQVVGIINVYDLTPPGIAGYENGVKFYFPDYKSIFTRLNVQHYINDLGVKEVWLWQNEFNSNHPGYNPVIHKPEDFRGIQESNMSSLLTGDISNSYRYDDLPIYNHTYTVYTGNIWMAMDDSYGHIRGHQIEAMLSYINQRQDGNTKLFWQDFVGRGPSFEAPIGRAGDCHHPPNTKNDYDYGNMALVESDIEDWKPTGGLKKQINAETWKNQPYLWPAGFFDPYSLMVQNYYVYWMQNMPGKNNNIPHSVPGKIMTNWWVFTGDWDYAITNNIGLHEMLTQLPSNAGTISGITNVCQGQNAVVYTVPPITYSSSYIWTLPTGATGTSSSNSINVNYGVTAVSGNITVKGNNALGDGTPSSLAINVTPTLGTAGSISGNATVCQGQNNVSYSVPIMVGASSYIWTLPAGASGSSSTNTISVNYGVSAASGNISVKGTNSCGDGTASALAIAVNQLPSNPGTISGATSVCSGQNQVTYTVPPIPGATLYVWALPAGASGSSATNSISVSYTSSAVSGNITVKGTNTCGDGSASVLPITVNGLPSNAGVISGVTNVCQGQNSVIYSVAFIPNATSYIWTLPEGASGTSSSNSISVNYTSSAISGAITVKGINTCGGGISSTLPITIQPKPESAGIISGATSVCQGQNSVTYSVATIDYATLYSWILPSGVTGFSDTKNIVVNFSNTAINGNITVKGVNACGDGPQSSLPITIKKLPSSAGAISGETNVCRGQSAVSYNITSIADATSYIWTLPGGATGSSASNSITVNFGTSAVSGSITVKGVNSCGEGTSAFLSINVNSLPPDPVITIIGAKLHSSAAMGNQWYNQNGLIPGATDQDYTITADGNYYVKVTINGCSSNQSNTINISHTGLSSIKLDKAISVFPNPVKDQITIELTGYRKHTRFEIINSLNQLVYKGFIDEKIIINASSLSGGIYLIKLENGEVVKFIK